MRLSDFEKNIDPEILQKGKEYWLHEAVQGLKEQEEDIFVAMVKGTEAYEASITMEGDVVRDFNCTCPYNWGPICKHIVALMFALRDYLRKVNPSRTEEKRPFVLTLEENLQKLCVEELREAAKQYAVRDRRFRSFIERKIFFKTEKHDRKEYIRLIRRTVETHTNRSGFISYYNAKNVVISLCQLLQQADGYIKQKKLEDALPILQALLEEGMETLNNSDSSGRTFAQLIEATVTSLSRYAKKVKNAALRTELFEYCLHESRQSRQRGWEWRWELIDIAEKLVANEQQKQQLFATLKATVQKERDDSSRGYAEQQAAEVALRILMRMGNEQEQEQFILAYLHFPSIRAMATERALSQKRIEEAKKLAEEGLKEKNRDSQQWAKVWYTLLFKAAEKEQASEDIRKYAEKIFLDHQDFGYYDKLKKTFSAKEWTLKVAEFLERRRSMLGIHALLHICIREEKWPEFLAILKEHCSLDLVIQYDKYLGDHFPKELLELYGEQIRQGLSANTGRKYYEHIADIFRRMTKLPNGKAAVKKLIEEFVRKYDLRTAMKDEFAKVEAPVRKLTQKD